MKGTEKTTYESAKKLTCVFDPARSQRASRASFRGTEGSSFSATDDGGWGGWQEGWGGKTGSSPPQIKGTDLDVHQRTQTGGGA